MNTPQWVAVSHAFMSMRASEHPDEKCDKRIHEIKWEEHISIFTKPGYKQLSYICSDFLAS